jgi:hypothetical protein
MDPAAAQSDGGSGGPPEPQLTQFAFAAGQAQQAVLGSGAQHVSFGVSAVPLVAAIYSPAPVFTAVNLVAFRGRAWLAKEIDDFMGARPCGYAFVAAEAGLGKTAFAAWLVKTRGYLSHFSRHPGGRSERGALQSLSAQLITHFGLDDLAPGEMLPEWAHSPAGFASVLDQAARQARAAGRRVVMVVDGMDEAEPADSGLPFGLPSLLPDGVYVIATYRTGWPPGRPDSPATTLWISKNDARNAGDIREFLQAAASEKVLAACLAEASIDPDDFVAMAADRCDGVWVYLRYVLDELRFGLRRADELEVLPAGLQGYYAAQIRAWQKDPAWHEHLLPLLATLAVAGEPLPADVLGRLAGGLDRRTVRRLCDFTFRPLLTAERPGADAALRYEIYHASFRQVLKAGEGGELLSAGAVLPYELEALADDLRDAAVAAHHRIADIYLNGFGGLARGLPGLAADPAAASADDGYPLRHLARHLAPRRPDRRPAPAARR